MATITGLTAERMLEIEAASVVDGDIVGNDLVLARHDGTLINAGNVRGAVGPAGPMGSSLAVATAQPVLDVGLANQIRAGRQLTVADFTNMGLSAPLGLWNLSNFNDSSGNARHFTNFGSVPLGPGINGLASTSAAFVGSTTQFLRVADVGGTDSFRIKRGSFGCWMRTTKRGTQQYFFGKYAQLAGSSAYILAIRSSNVLQMDMQAGVGQSVIGNTNIADGRWHFCVATYDGQYGRLYVDGTFDSAAALNTGVWNQSAVGPLLISGYENVAGTSVTSPLFGGVDEAFITADILTEEHIRNLYCASLPHALGSVPRVIDLGVRRKIRGGALATTDFPAQPSRLYNFVNGALTDQGANNTPLTNPAGFLVVPGPVGPADAFFFGGAGGVGLQATDAGLPSLLAARSYGIWFKTATSANQCLLGWGTDGSADAKMVLLTTGALRSDSGADSISSTGTYFLDGNWHHAVTVEDNAAADGVKRKLYVDGFLMGGSTVMTSLTLAGANRFRIGANPSGPNPFGPGDLSRAFVYPGVLTQEQVRKLYDVGPSLAVKPYAADDFIEATELGRFLVTFDVVESADAVDLAVMA